MINEQQLNTIKEDLNLWSLFIDLDCNNKEMVLYIGLNNGVIRTFKLPKKDINKNWIENKLNIINGYKNLTSLFKNLNLKYKIYYTTFGFSYDLINCLFSEKAKIEFKKDIEKIKNRLDSLNIKYKNEFSDAHFVYRFIISKEKSNLKIIENLK